MKNINSIRFGIVIGGLIFFLSGYASSEQKQLKNNTQFVHKTYLISENGNFKKISLPFYSEEYVKETEMTDDIYPFYRPSDILIDYLISIDYEGEEYKCYILPPKSKELILLVWIPRGDSEYYLLILLDSQKIITYKEIGKGGDDSISFLIKEDFSIYTYNNNGSLGQFLIQNNKITKITNSR